MRPKGLLSFPMKIIYLVQAPRDLPPTFRDLRERAGDRLIWLTFAAPADGALYLPNSSWTQGRNRLLAEAVERHSDFDYLVFCDDDLVFTKGSWVDWEKALEHWKPTIASPSYPHPKPCAGWQAHTLYNFDAMMNAFHRTCLEDGVLLPYIEKYDSISWWLSQFFLMHFANALYPGGVAKFTDICVDNTEHRDYPRIKLAQFEPFAGIYFDEGWIDRTVPALTFRPFHDLEGETYTVFEPRERPMAIDARARAAVALDGALLGSRPHL